MQSEQRQPRGKRPSKRYFTASEVAAFEYCPLAWWHEQYEPAAQADTEELFARMVELEHEHGPQATALPEYQLHERLLLRRGAFDTGQEQHREHAEALEEAYEEARALPFAGCSRRLMLVAIALLISAIVLIAAAILLR
ncbi:hypothetical protein [Thermogemmatispora sp.]|uniref:hypothetical protein n=1 Tax=Thermogemmatispora sp. TaxID=1968838 RepID=UPI001DEAE37A|nr:hypothetical protein [Thermogemmatispora sp.]MBX5452240.1 hypothetical protein [Thermogemmatispora sp.]